MKKDYDSFDVPMDLAMRLTSWHSAMGDPIYAVSSSTLAGRSVPRSVLEGALSNMEWNLRDPRLAEHKREIQEIVLAIDSVLGESDVRQSIIHAIARVMWASAWADEMEDRLLTGTCSDRGISSIAASGELTHLAPETPDEAIRFAESIIGKFEEANNMTLEEFVEKEAPADFYDFGGELAMHHLGGGSGVFSDYKIPWIENNLRFEVSDSAFDSSDD